jgi:hypothetical protein
MLVFCDAGRYEVRRRGRKVIRKARRGLQKKDKYGRTTMGPITATMVIKMLGPLPKASV